MARRKLEPRKLLVASAGAATLVYLGGCANDAVMTGNLVAPPDMTPATPSVQPTTASEQAAPSGTASEASAAGPSATPPTTAGTAH
jgi:hypothetical protein